MKRPLLDLVEKEELDKYDLSFLEGEEFGGWRVEEDTCRFIGRLCEELRPRRILEFGSGLSTLILAHEALKGNIEKIYSVDHLKDFPGHPRELIKERRDAVSFCHFPIRLKFYEGKLFQFYSIPGGFLKSIAPLDLVIIDGPPYYYNGREAALYAVYPYLTGDSIILLDDANRINYERVFIDNWNRYFGRNIKSTLFANEFKKGLAVIEPTGLNEKISGFSARERVKDSLKSVRCEILRVLRGEECLQ